MQDHDIPKQPIFATDDEGLDHAGTVHTYDCPCQQCAVYWSFTTSALDAMLAPCEGDDCQGCPKCPEWTDIFTPYVPPEWFITLDEAKALVFDRDHELFASFTMPLDVDASAKLPAMLTRDDGETLFYDGMLNSLFGESSACKSWIALKAAIQKVRAGGRCVFWDFEDSNRTAASRLNHLGAQDVIDSGRIKWASPAMAEFPAAILDAVDWAKGGDVPGMTIIDATESGGLPVESNNAKPWYEKMGR